MMNRKPLRSIFKPFSLCALMLSVAIPATIPNATMAQNVGDEPDFSLFFQNPDTAQQWDTTRRYLPLDASQTLVSGDVKTFELFFSEKEPARMVVGYDLFGLTKNENGFVNLRINGTNSTQIPLVPNGAQSNFSVDLPPALIQKGWNQIALEFQIQDKTGCAAQDNYAAQIKWRTTSSFIEGSSSTLAHMPNPGPDGRYSVLIAAQGIENSEVILGAAQDVGLRFQDAAQNLSVWTPDSTNILPQVDFVVSVDGTTPQNIGIVPTYTPQNLSVQFPLLPFEQASSTMFESGETKTFQDLGYITKGWNQSRTSFDLGFQLPNDFLGNNQGVARFNLDGIYPKNLSKDARIDILLNGQFAGSTLFPSTRRGNFDSWMIDIPLHNAKPGQNKVTMNIYANTDKAQSCASTVDTEPFSIFDSSTVKISKFGRATTASLKELFDKEESNITVLTKETTPETMTAVAQILAQQAQNERVKRTAILRNTLKDVNGPSLIIGTPQDFSSAYLENFGLSYENIEQWSRSTTLPEQADGNLNQWAKNAQNNAPTDFTRFQSWIQENWDQNVRNNSNIPQQTDKAILVAGDNQQALLLSNTMIDAQTALNDMTKEGISLAHVHGNLAVDQQGNVRTVRTNTWPHIEDTSLSNLRLVISDIFSERPWFYALVVLFTSVVLGLFTWLALGGRRNDC